MSFIKERRMKTCMMLAMAALIAGCASKRAVPVDCEGHLSPINVPAVIADPRMAEPQAQGASES